MNDGWRFDGTALRHRSLIGMVPTRTAPYYAGNRN
jgi:hypothetical protein